MAQIVGRRRAWVIQQVSFYIKKDDGINYGYN